MGSPNQSLASLDVPNQETRKSFGQEPAKHLPVDVTQYCPFHSYVDVADQEEMSTPESSQLRGRSLEFNEWDEEALSFVPPSTLSSLGSTANWARPRRQSVCGEDAQKPEVDFLASFGGVTTAAAPMTKVGHQEAYGRHQSSGLRRSWLDPNFSASSDLSCTSVMAISSPLTSSESVRSPFDSPFGSLGSPAISPPRPSTLQSPSSSPRRPSIIFYKSKDASALAERESFEETPTKLDLQINQATNVELLSTPEVAGLLPSTWPSSPTRAFVRNFP